jgi:hypothetical protein
VIGQRCRRTPGTLFPGSRFHPSRGYRAKGRPVTMLEFAGLGCYIIAVMTGRGWMLRITGPILG